MLLYFAGGVIAIIGTGFTPGRNGCVLKEKARTSDSRSPRSWLIYYIQPSCSMAMPSFQTFVMWLRRPSSKCMM